MRVWHVCYRVVHHGGAWWCQFCTVLTTSCCRCTFLSVDVPPHVLSASRLFVGHAQTANTTHYAELCLCRLPQILEAYAL